MIPFAVGIVTGIAFTILAAGAYIHWATSAITEPFEEE